MLSSTRPSPSLKGSGNPYICNIDTPQRGRRLPELSVHLERDLADWVTPAIHLVGFIHLLETPEGPTQVIGYQTASTLANARGAT